MDFGTFSPLPGVQIRYAHAALRTQEPRGTAVLLHGRTEFIEKYEEVIWELGLMGFEVWTFDWRGQGLSTRSLENGHKGHIDDFDDYLGDLARFIEVVVRPVPGPMILVGHSMGGHVGLRYLREHPGVFDLGVFTAPMLGVNAPIPNKALGILVSSAVVVGLGGRYASDGDYGLRDRRFFSNRVTRDPERFRRACRLVRDDPRLAVGGMTIGWLNAAMASMAVLMEPSYARGVEVPVLLVCAGQDQRVDNRACHAFAAMAPDVTLVTISDAEHEILMERDAIRERFWESFTAFLRGHLGA